MLKWLLIWRYFIKRRVGWLAVAAVCLIVMMVLVVLSVLSGLLADTRMRNHRYSGDIVLSRDSLVGFPHYEAFIEKLKQKDIVNTATPVIKTFGLIEGSPGQLLGLRLDEFCQVTGFRQTLHFLNESTPPDFHVNGTCYRLDQCLLKTPEQRNRGCIVGAYLISGDKKELDSLRQGFLTPQNHLPWKVTVFALNSRGRLTGSGLGERQVFWYVDDAGTGLVDIDISTMYVDFTELQKLCYMDGSDGRPSRTSEIRIKLTDDADLEMGRDKIAALWQDFVAQQPDSQSKELMTDVSVQTWPSYRRDYIAPAEKEKNLMTIIFGMLSLVSVFIIFAIFYMIVTEKIKDLGIIRSAGATSGTLRQIFLGYALLIGLLGGFLGAGLGITIVHNSNEIAAALGISIWDPRLYAIDRIPDVVDYTQAAIIVLAGVVSCVAGAILPARRAAKLVVIDALRVE